ncbi:MAG: putative amidohydrolase YtcJ, partial [Planctomycetota bacterium]
HAEREPFGKFWYAVRAIVVRPPSEDGRRERRIARDLRRAAVHLKDRLSSARLRDSRALTCLMARSMHLVALGTLVLTGCISPSFAEDESRVLFFGGAIYPAIGAEPVEAMCAVDGRVVAIGSRSALEELFSGLDCTRIDLQGCVAIPGLQDAHGSIVRLSEIEGRVDLVGAGSLEEVVARIQSEREDLPHGSWLLGEGWAFELDPDHAMTPRSMLTTGCPDHPVYLRSRDGESALLNQHALEIIGLGGPLDAEALPEAGGVGIGVDGLATGVLVGPALELARPQLPSATRAERMRQILAAQDQLFRAGTTCVHDMGVDAEGLQLLAELRDAGRLQLRIAAYLDMNSLQDPDELSELPSFDDSQARLRLRGGYLVADGSIASRGAALLEDYADAAGERGALRSGRAQIVERVRWLVAAGLQPAIRASGDRAVRVGLDCLEQVLAEEAVAVALRPRLERIQQVSRIDRSRFAAAGIIPSLQPTQSAASASVLSARMGSERMTEAEAWQLLTGDELVLAFGTAFPTQSVSVLESLAAVARANTASTTAVEDALRAFTEGAAFAVGEERQRGRLELGYACDMTVLDVDPHAAEPEALAAAKVSMTVIDGQIVFRTDAVAVDEARAYASRARIRGPVRGIATIEAEGTQSAGESSGD